LLWQDWLAQGHFDFDREEAARQIDKE